LRILSATVPASANDFRFVSIDGRQDGGLGGKGLSIKFIPSPIAGCFVVEPELLLDERGFFTHTWNRDEFVKQGISELPVQSNISLSTEVGTVRGMHYQRPPKQEGKLVRCTQGALFDVVVDLRMDSPSYRKWFAQELTAENHLSMWVPLGCAHGFQTLQPNTEVTYLVTAPYSKQSEGGIRWDDPAIGIKWPVAVARISERDRSLPLLDESKGK
jgi:dTDP-4-dehydrorhamnose 3,5-epimerase